MDQPATIPQAVGNGTAVTLSSAHATPAHCGQHTRGLVLIGLFKLSKAALAVLSGFAAYHLTHVDPGELAMRLITLAHIDPMGRLATAIMNQADTISARGFRHLGQLSFLLAVLYVAEGGGLMAQKVWAEYLTVVMTAAAMPFEIYEIVERYTDVRVAVFVINVAVVAYLIVLLREKRRKGLQCG